MKLEKYKTIIFDCDGVVLDSNKVKTEAFYNAVLPYGEKMANTFVDYHKSNGGVSRYKKFKYFLEKIIIKQINGYGYDELLEAYANEVFEGMIKCQEASGLKKLREKTNHANWLIASGGDQKELNEIFTQRGLISLFNGGIFGSPDTKEVIFERELLKKNIRLPALFLGDSKYDYLASKAVNNIDFIFLSDWTEVSNWKEWTKENKIVSLEKLSDFLI